MAESQRMSNKHIEKIIQAYKDGLLNEYMVRRMFHAAKSGMTDGLSDELIQDARDASDFGVNSDKDYNVYFFVHHFADDILDDTFGMNLAPDKKKDLCQYLFSHKDNEDYSLDNLTDHRLLTHKWLCEKLSKKAYPNTMGKENRDPIHDIDKWIGTLKNIYGLLHSKKNMSRKAAIEHFTADWDPDETQKFVNWMRYYEDGTTEKYNVKNAKLTKKAEGEIPIPQSWINREDRANDGMNMSTFKADDGQKTKREQELEKAKTFKVKMRSRLRSLKRLIDKYNDILPQQSLENIYDEIHVLEKSISKLNAYASIQDCIIRSANRIKMFGFEEGATFLKTAAEPEPAVGKDVVDVLPVGEPNKPNLPANSAPMFTITTIIDRLEGVSKLLKSRDMIRELASIDILLNELGMASYFPELTDAQSKMIEAFGYASNKVESIVAKLRGSGTSKTKDITKNVPPASPPPAAAVPPAPPAPPAEPIDTGGLLEKPVGEVQKKLPTEPK